MALPFRSLTFQLKQLVPLEVAHIDQQVKTQENMRTRHRSLSVKLSKFTTLWEAQYLGKGMLLIQSFYIILLQ